MNFKKIYSNPNNNVSDKSHFKSLFITLPFSALFFLQACGDDDNNQLSTSHSIENSQNTYIVVLNQPDHVRNYKNKLVTIAAYTAQANTLASEYRASMSSTFGMLGMAQMKLTEDMMTKLAKDPRVKSVEKSQKYRITPIISANGDQPDPDWGLDRIDQRNLPLNANYHFDYTGEGVNAYIIDSGIRTTHNDFDGRAFAGYNAIDGSMDSDDCNGHGTHVAGLLGSGTYGVAKEVRLYGVKVLNCDGFGSDADVLDGIEWVLQNAQTPAVANLSLGGGPSIALDEAVEKLAGAGISVSIAAGNENNDACNYSPKGEMTLGVGSSNFFDYRSYFSNFGQCVDMFAPGSYRRSLGIDSPTSTIVFSGTSMAAPTVGGAMALILEQHPDYSAAQVKEALLQRASMGKLHNIGIASPNKLLFTLDAIDNPSNPNPEPEPKPYQPCNDETCLKNNVPVKVSGDEGSEKRFYIDVPQGVKNLRVRIKGGRGDADLYVRFGMPPTQVSFDCRPFKSFHREVCFFRNPQAGRWHIMLQGWTDYKNVKLLAKYPEPTTQTTM